MGFREYAQQRDDRGLDEGWWDAAKGAVAGAGHTPLQFLRGAGNMGLGGANMGLGVVRTAAGLGKGVLGGGWDTAGRGMQQMGRGIARGVGGAIQAGTAPAAGLVRAYQAGQQDGLGKPEAGPGPGGKFSQFMGLTRKPQPGQDSDQSQQGQSSGQQATSPPFDPRTWSQSVNSVLHAADTSGRYRKMALEKLRHAVDRRLASATGGQPETAVRGQMPPRSATGVDSSNFARRPQDPQRSGLMSPHWDSPASDDATKQPVQVPRPVQPPRGDGYAASPGSTYQNGDDLQNRQKFFRQNPGFNASGRI